MRSVFLSVETQHSTGRTNFEALDSTSKPSISIKTWIRKAIKIDTSHQMKTTANEKRDGFQKVCSPRPFQGFRRAWALELNVLYKDRTSLSQTQS